MKKLLIIVSAMLCLSSCHFLEVERVGKSDIETYFSEINSLEPAINGVYNLSQPIYDKYVNLYASIVADEVDLSATSSTWVYYYNFTRTSSDETTMLGYVWKYGYNVINNCNQIIEHAPALREDNPNETDLVDRVEAQAYFFRALMHFELVRLYGQNYTYTSDASHLGVPVVDHVLGLTEKISRSSVAKVYSQVISDLETSLDLYPESYSPSQYYASPSASKALLARVYLYMENWQDAYDLAAELMASKSLTSRSNYVDMFCSTNSVSDDECFLRIHGYEQGKTARTFYLYDGPEGRPSSTVTDLFSSDDIRGSLMTYGDYGTVNMKFCTLDGTTDEEKYYHIPLLRVSEMYLIHAEAAAHLGKDSEALDDLRALEARARGVDQSEITFSSSDVLDLVAEERIKELCFEGHRFFDITRRHEDLGRMDITYPDWRYVLPIPQVELDANENIEPNPTSNE